MEGEINQLYNNEDEENSNIAQLVLDLESVQRLPVPVISSTSYPLDQSLPPNNDTCIDLTNDDPSPPDSPNDCVALTPNDESLSIVYENIKPPPDLNVEVDQGSGDIVVELSKQDSEPYNGYLTKRIKLGPSNVNLCVTVNTVKKKSSGSSNSVAQRMKGKISISNLLGKRILVPTEKEAPQQSTSTSSSNSTPVPSNNSTVDCAICLDSYGEIVASNRNLMSTSCGHVFCNECIAKCRECYKNCPKCRKRLTKRSYRPLYLS